MLEFLFLPILNTCLFALKISGFTLHRLPEDNSTKELVSRRFCTTCMDFRPYTSGNSHFSADLPTPFWAFELDDKQPAMLARPALPTNELIPHFEYVEYHVYILVCYLNFYTILSSLSVGIQQSL